MSKTLTVWPMLHFPIFLADCDYRGAMQFDTFCQSKKSQVFIQSYNLLLLQRLLKIFNHGQYGLTHIVLSKKKTKLRSNGVVLHKNFIQELYVLNHIVLSSIFYKFPRKALFFSLFSSKAAFFSLFTPF